MQNVPEGFFHQTTAQRQSGIYETDPPSSLSYPRIQITWSTTSQKVKIISKVDHYFTRKVTETKYIAGQAELVSSLHSLLCLMIHLIFTYSFSRS